ncbi:MAG: PhzF family phenazine biosynthesis protein, partial [Polyangiales bacterium]
MATIEVPLYHVDAFARRPFEGNPAAVCPLESWLPDRVMQAIAQENNLSETAFVLRKAEGSGRWSLRWFTPTDEVDLCGHATLASAWVVCEHLDSGCEVVRFETRSGPLEVRRRDGKYAMDLPAHPPEPLDGEAALAVEAALRTTPEQVLSAGKLVAVLSNATEVKEAAPDLARVEALDGDGLIVTAPGDDCYFVSRYFAPHVGIGEDPV